MIMLKLLLILRSCVCIITFTASSGQQNRQAFQLHHKKKCFIITTLWRCCWTWCLMWCHFISSCLNDEIVSIVYLGVFLILFARLAFPGKVWVPRQKPVEMRKEEVTTLDPELEEALSSATDTELCDLAGKTHKKDKSFKVFWEKTEIMSFS